MSRERVEAFFRERFQSSSEWIVRCPGRVNIIGEHIDYSGYSVLPMAIEESLFIAIGKSQSPDKEQKLHFVNTNATRYESATCSVTDVALAAKLASSPPKWYQYFIAGWHGALKKIFSLSPDENMTVDHLDKIYGLNIAVDSSIPVSAGLSSSSAMVSAATLATLVVQSNDKTDDAFKAAQVDKTELAEIATLTERYVGLEGGGMDQACECLANAGSALRIDFNPLVATPIQLPKRALFAVLHSGVEMNKAATTYYNQRVVECRIAAQILCKKGGKLRGEWSSVRTLKQAAALFGFENEPHEMIKYVEQFLTKQDNSPHTRNEVCKALEIDEQDLMKHSLNSNTQQMTEFWLVKRARHVFTESSRVLEFESVCRQEKNDEDQVLKQIATLMNQSHESCRSDFECSCPELDTTVEKCLKAGCLGARLTGAGWGGCVVALVDANTKEKLMAAEEKLGVLFWSEPSQGIEAFRCPS
ncbi:galactokinase galactose-binding signature domain-containing protein [Ditylenchus destructor]|uniref:Galactokinase galactose-binding signature domain-containing protein n=1 Tax=Ditylenchus destructor TaxID=166010 RepID=A0AAD4N0P1_9BILA|nr:galactokinase galactose-binding signature domain-containing protein [Ditylenchus destructor]